MPVHDPAQRSAWFHLASAPGLAPAAARRLLGAFGSPAAVLAARPGVRRLVVGDAARPLERPPPGHAQRLAALEAWLDEAPTEAPRHLLALGDPDYPAGLLTAADPPLLLYAMGPLAALARPSIAIVGSQNPTPQGVDLARDFARELGARGLAVVSGLGAGIEAAALEGALAAGGATVAVAGAGLDRWPPRGNAAARTTIADGLVRQGLLVAEHPPGGPARPAHPAWRDRLVAGLAQGTLVVEAGVRSTALRIAGLAAEAGRDVFAIPGSIHSPQARGCHALIRQGAQLVETVHDILGPLPFGRAPVRPPARPPVAAEPAAPRTEEVLAALGRDPATVFALAARTGLDERWLAQAMKALMRAGRVRALAGGLYVRA